MAMSLRLFEDQLVPGQRVSWRAAPRAIYVRSGHAEIAGGGAWRRLAAGECALSVDAAELAGDGEIWTFEVAAQGVATVAPIDRMRIVLAHDVDLDPSGPVLLRADTVAFPPDAATPRHGHKGPGIRRLLHGRLLAEIGGETRMLGPGAAWFESGRDPVVGRNLAPSSAFVRALVLDPALKGQPTFVPWTAADAAMPRGARSTQFFDEIVAPPPAGGS
jgi:quercetin dioxygenase-like cupin family protein